jgi:predicted heme/steroid binding protein
VEATFSRGQLLLYNGDDRSEIYIAFQGVVYDVTDCPKWRSGLHEGLHWPGQDLTSELADAPHMAEVFNRPCVRRVGRLVEQSFLDK